MAGSILETLAQERTNEVIVGTIGRTIEKIAAELAAEILKDPEFRQEVRRLAQDSFVRAVRDLRRTTPKRRKKR